MSGKYDVLVVGAGITGLTIAERCASVGKRVLVVDRRSHFGGNCFDEYDERGCLVHRYGPHIFHTASLEVAKYLSEFTSWRPYQHRVVTVATTPSGQEKVMPMPVNATTLEQFFDVELETEEEAEAFLESKRKRIAHPRNSEEVCLDRVGPELYEALFKPYTIKQWGRHPSQLAPGVCGRIPVRTNRDDRYFTDWFQQMPANGYTAMFEAMINRHKGLVEVALDVEVRVGCRLLDQHEVVVWTGPLDMAFNWSEGVLPWRSLDFELYHVMRAPGTMVQPAAVVNCPSSDLPYTRETEYSWLTGQMLSWSAIHREFPSPDGEPYYPVPSPEANELAQTYRRMAKESKLIVCGRLGRYQYLEMGQAVASALKTFKSEPRLHS